MIKRDCFGCVPGQKDCQVMTENICEKRKCSFYKTREDYKRGLVGLPPVKGDMPVKKVGRKGKTVRCVDTGEEFDSATIAAYELGFTATEISKCCRGELKSAKGYRFEYVEVE